MSAARIAVDKATSPFWSTQLFTNIKCNTPFLLSNLLTGRGRKKLDGTSASPYYVIICRRMLWQTSLPRGEKYPGKFNKNRDCMLLTVQVYLSLAVEGGRMQPKRKIKAEELRRSLKLPLINKNALQEKRILQLRGLNRCFSAGGFCPPGDNVCGHFWLS